MTARHSLTAAFAALLLIGTAPLHSARAEVGSATAVNAAASGTPPGGAQRTITLGRSVVSNERIATDGTGLVQILLLDGTTFTVSPNSAVVIDRFVYDPDAGTAELAASVAKGTFRFVGGLATRRGAGARINTPQGTLGIRGAIVEASIGPSEALVSLVFGREVTLDGDDGCDKRIFQAGFTMELGDGGCGARVRKRTRNDAENFQIALSSQPGETGGARNVPTRADLEASEVIDLIGRRVAGIPVPKPRPVVQASRLADVEIISRQIVREQVGFFEPDFTSPGGP